MAEQKLSEILLLPYMRKFLVIFGGVLLLSLLATVGFFDENMLPFFVLMLVCITVLVILIALNHKAELGRNSKSGSDADAQASELKAEIKRLTDDTSVQTLELEKQLSLQKFPLSDHFIPFIEKLENTGMEQISGITHTQFMELYKTLEETFARNNALPLSRLTEIPDDVRRVNQIETLIDLYGKKMQRVRNDENLDEEDRDNKLANWERLMERDISRLEES